ncbi:hypothetical protein EYV94_10695 [Puteibacter caeruleilacunae]|nr:hypothetical protein EYV94_10695 [Puteibacter caeruleilacunae]
MGKPLTEQYISNKTIRIFFVAVVVAIAIFSYKAREQRTRFTEVTTESSVSMEVHRTLMQRVATTFVRTSDDRLFQIPWADNMAYEKKHLAAFIERGDSIYKQANSDSIFVIRKGQRYHFVLEERIWK